MTNIRERGLALWCDAGGMILQTLRNDLHLAEAAPGRLFLRLVDSASRVKAMNFLTQIKETGAAFDCELNVALADGPTTLHFSGGQVAEQLLIVGALDGQVAAQLYEDLLRMSNEQSNRLRALIKEQARDAGVYDEISRLNNELVAMQRELAKKNAELERLNALKNQFLGMAAHDLRNPLHLIMAFSDMLLEDAVDVLSAEQAEYLRRVITASDFMSRIIDDFLSVAIIESGHFQLNLDVVDLADLLEQVEMLVGAKARKKDIEIVVTHAPAPLRLIVDSQKIQQVLINLLTNAIEHSYPGSSVAVRAFHTGDEVVLEVEDHGVGIAKEDLGCLFDPFEHKQSAKTGGEKSTGLGLTISRQAVMAHGGSISVESHVGQGSIFRVTLPRKPRDSVDLILPGI